MDDIQARQFFLKLFIAFLSLSALIAIVSVLGGEFGELQMKILATTFSISAASICAMSCAATMERPSRRVWGLAGIGLCAASAAFVIFGIWAEVSEEAYWKLAGTVIAAAVGLAHAFLLNLPELAPGHRWIQTLTSVSIGVLAVQIALAIWGEIDAEAYYRALAVVSIVVVLETLVIPILMKMRRDEQKQERLVLEKLGGDLFIAPDGRLFRLEEVTRSDSSRLDSARVASPASRPASR